MLFKKRKMEHLRNEIQRSYDFFIEEVERLSLEETMSCIQTPLQQKIESSVTNGMGYPLPMEYSAEPREVSSLEFQVYLGLKEYATEFPSSLSGQDLELKSNYIFLSLISQAPSPSEYRQYDQKIADEKRQNYTLPEIIGSLTRKGLFRESSNDCSFTDLFKGSNRLKVTKEMAAAYAAFGVIVLPHELIHAGVNSLTGGVNKEIVLNRLYGGDLWAQLFPGIEVKVLNPFFGGYVAVENSSALGNIVTTIAPYPMTALGFYALQKGKEKKNIPLCAAGAALVYTHLGGVIGDWWRTGQIICRETMESVCDLLGTQPPNKSSLLGNFIVVGGGMVLGMKMLTASYRLMKGTVNSLRQWYAEKSSFPMLPPHN